MLGKPANLIQDIDFDLYESGKTHRLWLHLIDDPLGNAVAIPVILVKGSHPGKTLGITAALHGNEINGISIIQRLINEIDPTAFHGNILAIPVVNIPSFTNRKRRFVDNVDLNHIMPGNKKGNVSGVYAYRFFHKVIKNIDYLLDLHTASTGRINSFYIRADMKNKITAKLAKLQNPDIIVHNPPADGTLRGAASALNIPAITLEVGNPNTFQKSMIHTSITGIYNAIFHLGMMEGTLVADETPVIRCSGSYWLYTDRGGILTVFPATTKIVEKGEKIAVIRDIFGTIIKEYFSPERGVVIGKSVNPVNQTGGRILHLGVLRK
nr:succinylglutamate desuccinylase/aspartoacylase family protein [Saprospiraceae bacterium]